MPHRPRRTRRSAEDWRPTLRFTPYAWANLLHLRDAGETEVGGFAVSSESDLFLVEDVGLVRQRCTEIAGNVTTATALGYAMWRWREVGVLPARR